MRKQFDLIVIGTGSAASTVAHECRSAGWNVAIIDSRPFGGTCALRGCDPKKVLVGVAEVVDWVQRMNGRGVRAENTRIEWSELMCFKRSFTEPVPKNSERSFAKAGIASFHGRARFVDSTAVEVGKDVLAGRHVVVATGAMPRRLSIPGEQYITASDQFLELEALPQSIVFIGGGYISFEFAHVAARAGAKVTILHRGQRSLEGFDPDLVHQLVARTERLGVRVEISMEVVAVEKSGDKLSVHASIAGAQKVFEADLVVHGAGRVPEIDDLNLAAAGVRTEERGVRVNEYLQSISNPAVFAAGDAAASGLPPLTPVAAYEGRIVASNLLKGNHRKVEHMAVPTIVFTIPPLAAVGLLEDAARQKGLNFRTTHEDTSGWYSSRRVGEECSGFKVLIEHGSDRLLGAHVIGPHADELVNIFALAMQTETPSSKLKHALFGYPTLGSDVKYML
jgi:glutathione reductase (NADPH)